MNIPRLENIRRVLALGAVHIRVPRIPYPPHWRSGQQLPGPPSSFGHQVKQQRLESHLLQADLAKALQVSVVSVSNWERGINQPSPRTRRKILDFLQQHRPE
jgi:DNA-binding transcriptional regulator YiaG